MGHSPVSRILTDLFAVAILCGCVGPAHSLTKTLHRAPERGGPWSSATSISVISYYNICTGWVWVWIRWESGSSIEIVTSSRETGLVTSTSALTFSGAPAGYGFTGTIALTDGRCGPAGVPLHDLSSLPCDAELLLEIAIKRTVGTDGASWSNIKALYR